MKFFKNIYNEIDFFFRRTIKYSRPVKGNIKNPEASKITDLLQKNINVDRNNIKILDIGAKNWFYVKELYNFFKYYNFEKEIWLDGIEIDAYRLYTDFHSRIDYARYYSKDLKNCKYIPGDLLKHNEKYDYITWFNPFVTENPLLEWGLPLRTLRPQEMLKHAVSLLKPNGIILIKNHDEKEYEIQQTLFRQLNIPYKKDSQNLITISQNTAPKVYTKRQNK